MVHRDEVLSRQSETETRTLVEVEDRSRLRSMTSASTSPKPYSAEGHAGGQTETRVMPRRAGQASRVMARLFGSPFHYQLPMDLVSTPSRLSIYEV